MEQLDAADPLTVEMGVDGEWKLIESGEPGAHFEEVPVGDSLTRPFRIANNTDKDVELYGVEGGDPAFAIGGIGFPFSVAAGTSRQFTITFTPPETNEFEVEMQLSAEVEQPFDTFSVILTGVGVPPVYYVDAGVVGGARDGSSWSNAFQHLQDALAAADPGSDATIRIATGVYYPDQGSGQTNNSRSSSFSIPDSVRLFGGYPAGGGAFDPDANPTVLSGDVDGNDVNLDGNFISETSAHTSGGNAFSVITVMGEATLSGLIVTGGLADGDATTPRGGGIYAEGTEVDRVDLTVNSCRIAGCIAKRESTDAGLYSASGAAIYVEDGDLRMTNSTLVGNSTEDWLGITGGTCHVLGEVRSVVISACAFLDNAGVVDTTSNASGLELSVSSLRSDAECTVRDTRFSGHHDLADKNGLLDFDDLASLRLERCLLIDNRCADLIKIADCVISVIESSLLAGNDVRDSLILLNNDVGLSVLNTTVARNSTFRTFRKISSLNTNGTIAIGNSVIDEPLGSLEPEVGVFRSHSLVEGFGADGNGNLSENTNPRYVDAQSQSSSPTALGDYRLRADSPLIDAGLNASNPVAIDLDGMARIEDGDGDTTATIDIGAYEFVNPIPPSIQITAVVQNPANGQITLTVESSVSTTFTAQMNADLGSGSWGGMFSGSLNAGSNTVIISGSQYGWPQSGMLFRLVTTAGGG